MNKFSLVAILLTTAVVSVVFACTGSPPPQPANSVNGTFPFNPTFIAATEIGGDGGANPPYVIEMVMTDRPLNGSLCGSLGLTGPTNLLVMLAISLDGGVTPGAIPVNGLTGSPGFGGYAVTAFEPNDGGAEANIAFFKQGTITFSTVTATSLIGSYNMNGTLVDGGAAQTNGNFSTTDICLQ